MTAFVLFSPLRRKVYCAARTKTLPLYTVAMDPRVTCFRALFGVAASLPTPLTTGVDMFVVESAAAVLQDLLSGTAVTTVPSQETLTLVAHVLSFHDHGVLQHAGLASTAKAEDEATFPRSDERRMHAEIAGVDTTKPFTLIAVFFDNGICVNIETKSESSPVDTKTHVGISDLKDYTNVALTRFVNAHERFVEQLTTPAAAIRAAKAAVNDSNTLVPEGASWQSAVWDGVST